MKRLALVLLLLSGCTSADQANLRVAGFTPASAGAPLSPSRDIKHVVIIVQENRTFDNFFHGFPGARYARYGYLHDGRKVALHSMSISGPTIWHNWSNAIAAWDRGRMDGFDLDPMVATNQPARTYVYAYVRRQDIEPYWTMASQYVLADHMFPTMFGPSFTGHLDLIAGTTDLNPSLAERDGPNSEPWGCDAPPGTVTGLVNAQRALSTGPAPCFSQFRTMADVLDPAHVSWKYYAPPISSAGNGGIWSEFDAIRNVRYGPDWHNVTSPQTRVLLDARDGKLPSVSWVIPDAADSDHVGPDSDGGPSWVASVVNAIGRGPDWQTSAIVVVWDDYGGWYDSEAPPQLDFRGLGIRVPCIIISPYAKPHYVSHTQYEFGSILKFVEETFGLPSLGPVTEGYTDARAHSLSDSFDFNAPPRAFTPIPAPSPASYFLRRPPSMVPPDEY
jgi:phospholipase C